MKSKDVVFLCQFFYPEYISSATLPFDTAKALKDAGYSVSVICGYPEEYSTTNEKVPLKEVVDGIEIQRLKYIQLKRSSFIGRIINYFSFTFSALLNLFKLRKFKIAIVYSNPPVLPLVTFIANKIFGLKIVFVSYDVYPEIAVKTNVIQNTSIISKFMEVINKVIFRDISKVVALSTEMKEYLINSREGLSKDNVEVIPNWYESDVTYNKNDAKLNPIFKDIIQNEPLIISYFGNMGIAQDMETILDTIRKLKDNKNVHFLFAGHGNKMETLKQKLTEEKIDNTTIFDFLHGQDFSDALAVSDAFIVSLESSLNGLCVPSKTYSYMSAGKPILAIMNPQCDISIDLANYNAGFTVETGQSEALVNHIITLGNEEIAKEMGNNCRVLFLKKFTKDICTNKYVDLINQVLESEACLQTKHY